MFVFLFILFLILYFFFFFFSSRRRHTRWPRDWSSDVCSSDLDFATLSSQVPSTRRYGSPRCEGGACVVSEGALTHETRSARRSARTLNMMAPRCEGRQKRNRPSESLAKPVSRFVPLEQ